MSHQPAIAAPTCPKCGSTSGSSGSLTHRATCPLEIADQRVLEADRARLMAEGYEGYTRPLADVERTRLELDGYRVREGAQVIVGTLRVNGAVAAPRMVQRDWSAAVEPGA